MGTSLTPAFAANLASDVYLIKSDLTRRIFNKKYEKDFVATEGSMVVGKTGGYVLNQKHVMAAFSVGQGRYSRQAFVTIKGTASLYDALTDLNAGIRIGHTGCKVHQGFYYAFDSIVKELRSFLSNLKDISIIHCTGHSLGGAIATLAADFIRANAGNASVKLYSFGSPRVGLEMFSSKCTSRLGAENIYRVYHRTDPVPMVPTWPFYHVPDNNHDYLVNSPVAGVPWEYHLMKNYTNSAEKGNTWEAIGSARPTSHIDSSIERWLKADTFVEFSASTLEVLNAAMLYVVKKLINSAGIALVVAASAGFTLLDRLAYFMAKATEVTSDVSGWVFHLVKKMARLIGIRVKEGTSLTVNFVRRVFLMLHRRIGEFVRAAGRAVTS